jgi:hypothetical protein
MVDPMHDDNRAISAKFNRMKPAVGKSMLPLLAAIVWIAAGSMMLALAYAWLQEEVLRPWLYAALGIVAGLAVHRYGFHKIANRNLDRIIPMKGRPCLFSFMSWKSYLLVMFMVGLGAALRLSPVPKNYLSVVYIAIGLALILSSARYLRR